jgi:hypothetical protein
MGFSSTIRNTTAESLESPLETFSVLSDFWVIQNIKIAINHHQADSQEKCLVLLESSHNRVFKQTAASSQPWREPPWLSRGDHLTQKNTQFLVVTSHQHMGIFSRDFTGNICDLYGMVSNDFSLEIFSGG